MTDNRIAVPPRLRFEVFKRDKFTCQYCGRKAPEAVLECDHITPIAGGGTNDILNLITSCKPCNGGKGAVPLSDTAAIDKQHDMLADLEERRQQIEMLLEWRDELQAARDDVVSRISDCMAERSGYPPDEEGRSSIRKWLKEFSVEEIVGALDTACDTYLRWDGDDLVVASWRDAFLKIPGIARVNRQARAKPYLPKLLYIQGILRKRSRAPRLNRIDYLEHLHLAGASLEEMQRTAGRSEDFLEFEELYDAWLYKIGAPY